MQLLYVLVHWSITSRWCGDWRTCSAGEMATEKAASSFSSSENQNQSPPTPRSSSFSHSSSTKPSWLQSTLAGTYTTLHTLLSIRRKTSTRLVFRLVVPTFGSSFLTRFSLRACFYLLRQSYGIGYVSIRTPCVWEGGHLKKLTLCILYSLLELSYGIAPASHRCLHCPFHAFWNLNTLKRLCVKAIPNCLVALDYSFVGIRNGDTSFSMLVSY